MSMFRSRSIDMQCPNDMQYAVEICEQRLLTYPRTKCAYRLKKEIAADVDDRIVVADVVVEFFQKMIAYLEEFPTQADRMSRYDQDPFFQVNISFIDYTHLSKSWEVLISIIKV